MFSFQKEQVEKQAIELLIQHDPLRYKNSIKKERPDFHNYINNVGIEIVTADFQDNALISQVQNKSFLSFLKMTDCPSIEARKIKEFINRKHFYAFEWISEKEPFIEENGKAVKLNNVDQLMKMKDKDLIFMTIHNRFNYLRDNNGTLQYPLPPAQWVGQLPNIMMERFEYKVQKSKGYKKFKENNLYIHTVMGTLEEIDEFKKLLLNREIKKNLPLIEFM